MSGMTRYWWRWALGKLLVLGGAIAFSGNCAFAQSNIVPDNTLGAQSSVVTPNVDINGIKSDRIDGGAIRSAIESGTASGNGGNITLSIQDILLLRRGSNISTTAGTDLKDCYFN